MESLLAKLQVLQISHDTVTHSCVMTSEAQAEALRDVPGAITKNLFLKDKKGRLYVVTALHSSKVDLKVLAARLGLGKGGLRMAPDDLIGPILGVPLGSVTPLALAQPSAAGVALLLDQGIRSQSRIFVHPGVNTASTALAPAGLETFLQSLGREVVYVDLQAAPQIDRDNPPDLKHIADAATPLLGSEDAAGAAGADVAVAAPVAAAGAPSGKAGKKAAAGEGKAGKAAVAAPPPQRRHDINAVTEAVVRMATERLLSAEGAAAVDGGVLRRLGADVAMELNALRNASYAAGFKAAQGAMAATLSTHPS